MCQNTCGYPILFITRDLPRKTVSLKVRIVLLIILRYNNKSDVWSLGCIFYELVTLKHAFEANNMKALVGKILRGTYPPISSTYTSDLRDMINKTLQKDPRDRPSINSVLKIPFIQKRMEFLLTKGEP